MNMTAVIVDDERRNRELLNQLLSTHCVDVEVLAMAAAVDEAVDVINNVHPDILFLDVRMGSGFGFDVLASLTDPLPAVIITTAHEQYAIKAVKAQVLDYLLKPIISDELIAAVNKARDRKEKVLSSGFRPSGNGEKRIAIPSSEGIVFLKADHIIRCEASGAYTEIFLKDGSKMITSTNLGEFENLLPSEWGFLRVHHSSIINLTEVSVYMKGEGGKVVMSDKSTVNISQRKKALFLEAVRRISRF
jgi:two-component system LytT family response regulator